MPGPLPGLVVLGAGFLLGAIPWGYLAGRITRGIDLRDIGSGGTGATNVLRAIGGRASAIVLILDILKGALAVFLARWAGLDEAWAAAAGVAAVVGHCWSPFIGFKGGKGVATGAGAAITLFPPVILVLPIMAVAVWTTKYVSLGSLIAAAGAAIIAVVAAASGKLGLVPAAGIVMIAAIIINRHAANIERLRSGTERKLGQSVSIQA